MTTALDAWRPALAAFYRGEGSFQSAENVSRLNLPLTELDKRMIDSLRAALDAAPVPTLARAA